MYNISGTHERQSRICRFGQWILINFVDRYPNLHKMDNLVIDCKLRSVKCVSGIRSEPVLRTKYKKYECFKLNNWEFEKFNTILKNRKKAKSGHDKSILGRLQEIKKRFDILESTLRE